jgi:hypothetical protein
MMRIRSTRLTMEGFGHLLKIPTAAICSGLKWYSYANGNRKIRESAVDTIAGV